MWLVCVSVIDYCNGFRPLTVYRAGNLTLTSACGGGGGSLCPNAAIGLASSRVL